jgi:ABC-type polysaccharide transport system permease subunit
MASPWTGFAVFKGLASFTGAFFFATETVVLAGAFVTAAFLFFVAIIKSSPY